MTFFRRSIFAALTAVSVAACTDSVDPVGEFPSFYGTWAGKTWVGEANAVLIRGGTAGDTLFVGGLTPANGGQYAKETITAKIVIDGTGTYLLGPGAGRFDELVGGDVVAASYITTSNSVGRVTITSYGGVNGLVEGTIQFEAETTSPYGSYGSKARLENAFFTAVVKTVPR
jgi:hypothetical protein